jgi:uncharacterized protein (DUF305 family)
MLWHHQQAHHMVSLIQGRTTRPELLRLAVGIGTAQSSDIAPMTAWLHARGPAPADAAAHSTTEPAGRWFAGMLARTKLRTLDASTGQWFDFLFVDMLLEHHKGAIVRPTRSSPTVVTQRSDDSPAERSPTRSGRSGS